MDNTERDKLINELVERSMNNSAAINVLVEIVCGSGLTTIENFNRMVRKEGEFVKKEMIENIKRSK